MSASPSLREGSDKPLDFNVVRDEIPRHSVDSHFLIRPGIGYMHVSGFQETTGRKLRKRLRVRRPERPDL